MTFSVVYLNGHSFQSHAMIRGVASVAVGRSKITLSPTVWKWL